jgi:tetratricopeptide (TPR) repeat protein
VAIALYGEGGALADGNQPREAIERLTRSIAIFEKNQELGSTDGLHALQVLSRAYGAREDWTNALATLDRAEALARTSYGEGSRLKAGLMVTHAFYLYRAGHIDAATKMLREAIAIQAASPDTNPRSLQVARQLLADTLCARGPDEEGWQIATGIREAAPADVPAWSSAIVSAIIAKCDSDPDHFAANEKVMHESLRTIGEMRGKSSVVARDMVRRLAAFYDASGEILKARETRNLLATEFAMAK